MILTNEPSFFNLPQLPVLSDLSPGTGDSRYNWLNDSPLVEYTKLKDRKGKRGRLRLAVTFAFLPSSVRIMFTGVVDGIGNLVKRKGNRFSFSVPEEYPETMEVGGSISVNGACLTAVDIDREGKLISADISPETRNKTNIGNLKPGDRVNLELPLGVGKLSDRLDGHLVQGHIDTTGKIGRISKKRDNYVFRIATPSKFSSYLVDKGSVAVDGVSLTPYRVSGGAFSVSVIPHTYDNTTLQFKHGGSEVNVEFDILAKYIRNSLKKTNPYR